MARTKRDPRLELPPLELECMKALWALGEATVNAVREQLLASRPLAYTTVMTIMDRLARRGAAERSKRSRAYLYRPLVTEDQVRQQALDRLLAEHFEGSRENLDAFLKDERPGRPESMRAAPRPEVRPVRRRPSATETVAPVESKIDEALL